MSKETFARSAGVHRRRLQHRVAGRVRHGEGPLYAAVWVAGGATGVVQVTLGQTVQERGQELLARTKQGLRPVLMAVEPGKL